jgi:cell division protein FtsA
VLKYNDQLIMALEIGSTKTVCAVGKLSHAGRLSILGYHEESSISWRKGRIDDNELAIRFFRNVVEAVQHSTGGRPYVVHVGMANHELYITRQNFKHVFSETAHRISEEDICFVFQMLKALAARENNRIIHVVPTGFYIDNQLVKEPLDLSGKCFSIEAIVISMNTEALDNLLMLLKLAGIKVKEVILGSLASADAVLNATEKEFGSVYVDIGGQTTAIVVYSHGFLQDVVVLPVGSNYITGDLAFGLGISYTAAEYLKLELGLTPVRNLAEEIEVKSGSELKRVSARLILDIIEARINEILDLIKKNIEIYNCEGLIKTGFVFGGGGAKLAGLVDYAEKHLDMPVRVTGPDAYLDAGTSTEAVSLGVIGLIRFRENQSLLPAKPDTSNILGTGWLEKIKLWAVKK